MNQLTTEQLRQILSLNHVHIDSHLEYAKPKTVSECSVILSEMKFVNQMSKIDEVSLPRDFDYNDYGCSHSIIGGSYPTEDCDVDRFWLFAELLSNNYTHCNFTLYVPRDQQHHSQDISGDVCRVLSVPNSDTQLVSFKQREILNPEKVLKPVGQLGVRLNDFVLDLFNNGSISHSLTDFKDFLREHENIHSNNDMPSAGEIEIITNLDHTNEMKLNKQDSDSLEDETVQKMCSYIDTHDTDKSKINHVEQTPDGPVIYVTPTCGLETDNKFISVKDSSVTDEQTDNSELTRRTETTTVKEGFDVEYPVVTCDLCEMDTDTDSVNEYTFDDQEFAICTDCYAPDHSDKSLNTHRNSEPIKRSDTTTVKEGFDIVYTVAHCQLCDTDTDPENVNQYTFDYKTFGICTDCYNPSESASESESRSEAVNAVSEHCRIRQTNRDESFDATDSESGMQLWWGGQPIDIGLYNTPLIPFAYIILFLGVLAMLLDTFII
jgi:hypothetical protein